MLWFTSIVNASKHSKCVCLNNQQCRIQPTLINLRSNGYIQGLYGNQFAVNLERCVGSCDILNDLSNKICVPNKTEDLNLSIFNMITEKDESKTLTKHISCECKCKFDCRSVEVKKCRSKLKVE